MNEKEIKKYVEEQIDYHCDEFGLVREEVVETVMLNIQIAYCDNQIEKQDLIKCGKYLGYDLDIEAIDEFKIKREETRMKRKSQKARKKEKLAKLKEEKK